MNIPIHDHPDEGDLLRYVDGELAELEVEEVEGHIANCVVCRDRYDDLAAASDSLTAFLTKADFPPRELERAPRGTRGAWWKSPLAGAAAVVLLLVGVGAPVGAFLRMNARPNLRVPTPVAPVVTGGAGSGANAGDVDRGRRALAYARAGQIDAALDLAGTIQSDFEAANVLAAVVGDQRALTNSQADAVLRIAVEISADSELSRLLRQMLDHAKLTPRLTRGMLTLSLGIASDFELTEFLIAFTARVPLTPELRSPFLAAAQSVASDFEAARLLEAYFHATEAEGEATMTPEQFETVASIAASIASDTELSMVLRRLLDRPGLSARQADELLLLSAGIASDFEMAEFLVNFRMRVGVTGDLRRAAYLEALQTITSDSDRARVLEGYVEDDLSTSELAGALHVAGSISSDFELANLLVKVAQSYQLRGAALQAFQDGAATIASDAESARVAEALAESRR